MALHRTSASQPAAPRSVRALRPMRLLVQPRRPPVSVRLARSAADEFANPGVLSLYRSSQQPTADDNFAARSGSGTRSPAGELHDRERRLALPTAAAVAVAGGWASGIEPTDAADPGVRDATVASASAGYRDGAVARFHVESRRGVDDRGRCSSVRRRGDSDLARRPLLGSVRPLPCQPERAWYPEIPRTNPSRPQLRSECGRIAALVRHRSDGLSREQATGRHMAAALWAAAGVYDGGLAEIVHPGKYGVRCINLATDHGSRQT